ncbi:MAG TPA: hypothetical protein VLC74_02685 [Rhizomicrobium sp.]|nr:hypothetical protein [Rhizomicrobium sp.]
MTIYVRGQFASAIQDGDLGGTIGNIKKLGTAVTLGQTINGKVRWWVIEYPFVSGGWWQHYETKDGGTGFGHTGSGTYTVEGSGASTSPH